MWTIFRKDLGRLWPHVLLLVGASVALQMFGGVAETLHLDTALFLASWVIWLSLIPAVVQLDSAVDSEAFWMTRPISPAKLFAAKLAFILLFAFVLRIAIQAALLRIGGFRGDQIDESLRWFAAPYFVLGAAALVLACLTFSIWSFWMAGVSTFLGVAIGGFVLTSMFGQFDRSSVPGPVQQSGSDLAIACIVLGGVAISGAHYRFRRRGVTISLALGLAAIAIAIKLLWAQPLPWTKMETPTIISDWPLQFSVEKVDGPSSGSTRSTLVVNIAPPKNEVAVFTEGVGAARWSDGRERTRRREFERYLGRFEWLQKALGSDMLVRPYSGSRSTSIGLPLGARAAESLQPVRYNGKVTGRKVRYEFLGVMTVGESAQLRSSGCRCIVEASPTRRAPYLQIKYWIPRYAPRSFDVHNLLFVLVNHDNSEAIMLDSGAQNSWGGTNVIGMRVCSSRWDVALGRPEPSSGNINVDWLAHAEIRVFAEIQDEPVELPVSWQADPKVAVISTSSGTR